MSMQRVLAVITLLGVVGSAHAQVQVIGPEPVVEDPSMPDRHTVTKDETLSTLAEKYLGNGDAWPKLWSYNPEITNPHWIYPGLVLRLKQGVPLDGPSQTAAAGAPAAAVKTNKLGSLRIHSAPRPRNDAVLIGEEVYLDGDALAHSAKVVGAPEDHFLLALTDEVYLKFKDDNAAPRAGQELTVFLRLPKKTIAPPPNDRGPAPKLSKGKGEVVRVVGALRINDFDAEKKIARAVITEALEPIERGFEVADVPRRLHPVPAKKNGKDLAGQIVSSSRGLGTLGSEQVVFINRGSKDGVEVGNRFQVVRQGDPWRQGLRLTEKQSGAQLPEQHPIANEALPPEAVADLHVLYVRPEVSTALIRDARFEVHPGDNVEMKAGY